MESRGHAVARAQSPLQDRRRRRRRRPTRTRSICSTRRSSAPGRSTADGAGRLLRAPQELHDQGACARRSVHTSWLSPDERVRGGRAPVRRRRSSIAGAPFLQAFLPFQARVAELGIYNSLAQLLIKITAPGVPDFYQGTELWDLSLVDPDNRRPVDYARRERMLQRHRRRVARPAPRRARRRPHQDVRHEPRARPARDAQRDTFDRGSYVPLWMRRVAPRPRVRVRPARRRNRRRLRACRASSRPARRPSRPPPLGPDVWGDSRIMLPSSGDRDAPPAFRNAMTGAVLEPRGDARRRVGSTWRRCSPTFRSPCSFPQTDSPPMHYLTSSAPRSSRGSILVLLFTPHIPYTAGHADRSLERPLHPDARVDLPDARYKRGNRIDVLTDGTGVLPGDARGHPQRPRDGEHGGATSSSAGEIADQFIEALARSGARRRPGHARHGRDRQPRATTGTSRAGCAPPGCRVEPYQRLHVVPPGAAEQPHAPRAAGRRRRRRVRRRRRRSPTGGLKPLARQADLARHDGAHRRAGRHGHPGRSSPRTGSSAAARS